MSTTSRSTTPLRRVSRGSISALSQSRGASATPLSFLEGALGNLADETSILSANLEELTSIHDSLNTFNEGFGMFLYGLKVAAYCIEWSEAPQEDSFQRAQERARGKASACYNIGIGVPQLSKGKSSTPSAEHARDQGPAGPSAADQTYVTVDEDVSFAASKRGGPLSRPGQASKAPLKSALKQSSSSRSSTTHSRSSSATQATVTTARSGVHPSSLSGSTSKGLATTGSKAAETANPAKAKITLAQRKKREKYAEEVIETLPLEYRGSNPAANRLAKSVIMALIAAASSPQGGARIAEIVKSPSGLGLGGSSDLPQAKVNKCLIALISAKQVVKASNNGILYSLDPNKHPQLP